mgnify:CR=1 FL=1
MTEAFLQYVWQHQLLQGLLVTTNGEPVVVERPGALNRDAGPDFFDARISIGGTLWVGNLEIHIKASDWNAHRHSDNRAYDNVVLHVVYENDKEITLHDGRSIPTLEIKDNISQTMWEKYRTQVLSPKNTDIPCAEDITEVPAFYVDSYMERLTLERLERKCKDVREVLHEVHGSWEHCCYLMMARYFGGKANAMPFELVAKNTDMNLLARWRDNPQRIEALLMGQAGLLEAYFEDEYPRQLQADYEALRQGAGLAPIQAFLWKFHRMRPNGFPTIRLSQFAQLVCRSKNLFSHLLETPDAEQLKQFFDVVAAPYWDSHFRFDIPSPGAPKHLGEAFLLTLIINAWVPLLFEYGNQHGQQHYKDQAVSILQQLPPEDNRILRQWKTVGITALNADQSQALLQLSNVHCSVRDCLNCQIGYKVIVK